MRSLSSVPATPLGEKMSVSAARILKTAILTGDLAPGQPLREGSLAAELGVSRTPVREAFVQLTGEGLIEARPNRPAVVKSFTAEDLNEMHSLRAVLEGYAARLAALNLDDDALESLKASIDRYASLVEAPTDGNGRQALLNLAEENLTFHGIIIGAAESQRLQGMIDQVEALPLIYRAYLTYSRDNREQALRDHRKLFAALNDHDADRSEALMKAHIDWARDLALSHLPLVDEAAAKVGETA